MQAILFSATCDADVSRHFYQDVLGLQFVSDTPYALVFDIEGTMLRIQKVEQVTTVPYTALGFGVTDIDDTVKDIAAKGIEFERYGFLEQDDNGVWTTPDGAKVAWCKDPDGNMVSFTQHPAQAGINMTVIIAGVVALCDPDRLPVQDSRRARKLSGYC